MGQVKIILHCRHVKSNVTEIYAYLFGSLNKGQKL